MVEFKISTDFIHLIQLLKALNWVQTGGHAQIVVMDGLVKYNGQVDYRKRLKVRHGDIVEFDGRRARVVQVSEDKRLD